MPIARGAIEGLEIDTDSSGWSDGGARTTFAVRMAASRSSVVSMAEKKKRLARRSPNRSPDERIAELEEELARLRELKRLGRRFSPESVRTHREKLELSAADYGRLVGVSGLTIYKWEKGDTYPRLAQLKSWLEVRGLRTSEAWQRLGYA